MNRFSRALLAGAALSLGTIGHAFAAPVSEPPVKLEIVRFTLAQPKKDQPVTASLSIKNTGKGTVSNIPWQVRRPSDSAVVGGGTIATLPSGIEVTVTASFAAGPSKRFQGAIDPAGSLGNTAAPGFQTSSEDLRD